jgi:hypothetical protein
VERNREAFLPALAMSLNNLSSRESEIGHLCVHSPSDASLVAGLPLTLPTDFVCKGEAASEESGVEVP